jgi:putative endonuclease
LVESGLESEHRFTEAAGMTIQQLTDQRNQIGRTGEAAVREDVTRKGWTVLEYNVRWRDGELDMIAIDGRTLVFAEVKTLVARGADRKPAFSPFESITRRKQMRIRQLARRWMVDELQRQRRDRELRIDSIRFDAFAVVVDRAHAVKSIEHLEDAF